MPEDSGEPRIWKLRVSYDGTEFHGWQIQPDCKTVQGELRAAIERVTGEQVTPQGSGRTDAGVHALAQVASFALSAPIPEPNLVRALNRTLPAAIRVLDAQLAPDGFHARYSAKRKTYEYRIVREEICPPWLAPYVYGLHQPLDLEAMRHAALQVLGEHDFTSFAASDPERMQREVEPTLTQAGASVEARPQPRGNSRTIYDSQWTNSRWPIQASAWPCGSSLRAAAPSLERGSDFPGTASSGSDFTSVDFLIYRVRGNGFLHHMVRNLVGTFLQVGRGNMTEKDIPRILEARARGQAGPTAPARGLFLVDVEY